MHLELHDALVGSAGASSGTTAAECPSSLSILPLPPAPLTQQRATELQRAPRALRRHKLHKRNFAVVLRVPKQSNFRHGACSRSHGVNKKKGRECRRGSRFASGKARTAGTGAAVPHTGCLMVRVANAAGPGASKHLAAAASGLHTLCLPWQWLNLQPESMPQVA